MPGACRIPAEKYPETADWGPLFWKLLHGLAENSGKLKDPNFQAEEIRNWINVITHIRNTLPCDICRNHYAVWFDAHNPTVLSTMNYSETKEWIKKYLWELHNEINEGNDKPTFDYSSLTETYKNVNITTTWRAIEPVIRRAITMNGVTLLTWKKWLNYVRLLQAVQDT
jgi:hypothetical protein